MTPAPPATTAPFTRYLAIFFATIVVVLGVAWAYVDTFPSSFMESGYASWTAKKTMLRDCQLGQIAFFGDSRLEAGIVPAEFPVPASNFGLAAGTAVEVRVAVGRALACPVRPRQAVISLVPEHFGPLSRFYWLLSIRYGFLSAGDVLAVERLAAELADSESFSTATPDGLSGRARDWLYAAGFPSLSFGSLVQGRIFGRQDSNRERIATVTADRGWAAYEGGAPARAEHPDRFVLTKLQNAELESAIAALRAAGVPTTLLIMPFSPARQETDATLAAYIAYLDGIAASTGVARLDRAVPDWPASAFADGAHLNPAGARAFTRTLGTCLKDGLLQSPCALPPPP